MYLVGGRVLIGVIIDPYCFIDDGGQVCVHCYTVALYRCLVTHLFTRQGPWVGSDSSSQSGSAGGTHCVQPVNLVRGRVTMLVH